MSKPKWLSELDIGSESEVVTNPWSGESIELDPVALAVYDAIRGAQALGTWDLYNKARLYFATKWPRAYMILVD